MTCCGCHREIRVSAHERRSLPEGVHIPCLVAEQLRVPGDDESAAPLAGVCSSCGKEFDPPVTALLLEAALKRRINK